MKKLLYIAILSAVALSMGSCRRAVEKARRNIRIEAVEKIERQGLTGAEIVVRVKNDTGYKLVLDQATLDIFYGRSRVGDVALRGAVEVGRRTTGSVSTRWRLRISDPLALYALSKKIGERDFSQVFVSFKIEGRGGPAPIKISQEKVPLSEFLNIFGVTIEDLKNLL
ncbi:hypothetical protein [Alistipes sp.]|uniref:hypothetical protein n=1 Tax=Alistipes sp. TaxID=1872444 RepID=UPI003AF03EBB